MANQTNAAFEAALDRYAELAVRVGAAIEPGQTLIVNAQIAAAGFARRLARKAYEAGARYVHMDWDDDESRLLRLLHAPEESLAVFPTPWKAEGFAQMAAEGAAYIQVYAPNPDLLRDVPPERNAAANKAALTGMQPFRKHLHNGDISWNMVAVPTAGWAAKLFPGLPEEEAFERIWDLIFRVTRVYEDDPVAAWERHLAALEERIGMLNSRRFAALHYKGPGTELTVRLPESHLWLGGSMKNARGVRFVPNMPTEEVFTLPQRGGVSGTVTGTKPLNYNGAMIENFTLTFQDGRVTGFTAEQGYETLKRLIETDEGSCRLGEVALVPHRSPVSDLGLIFYNTMFDENASCHFALGNAYPACLEQGTAMSREELLAHGANVSLTHVDFMIGSAELDIDGETTDGVRVPLFRKGDWAFK